MARSSKYDDHIRSDRLDSANQNVVALSGGISNATSASRMDLKNKTMGFRLYKAVLAASGANAPAVTVIENTLSGSVTWTRSASGSFLGTLTGGFPQANTWVHVPQTSSVNIAFGTSVSSSGNTVVVTKYSASVAVDNFQYLPVDIKVFV